MPLTLICSFFDLLADLAMRERKYHRLHIGFPHLYVTVFAWGRISDTACQDVQGWGGTCTVKLMARVYAT